MIIMIIIPKEVKTGNGPLMGNGDRGFKTNHLMHSLLRFHVMLCLILLLC